MSIIQNIKSYFEKKKNHQETANAPEGICPNCWGKQEWEGQFYKVIKGEDENPNQSMYDNFIQDVARKLDKIVIKKDTYLCETCEVKYDHN
jgi:hypothetical protein